MAALNELIQKIENPELRAQVQAAADKLAKQKKFGLVFEEHLPECTPLYDIPIRKGLKVSTRNGKANKTYTVLKIEDGIATCLPKSSKEAVQFPVEDLVTTAELGDPIYPCLQSLDEVCNAPDSELWHTLIEADNYHALQLLEYLYAGKVDCIYIDPPYNTRAKDWKYNNDYVDPSDEYRHSKWLSFMKKRLEIAKRLLNLQTGVLIVTIDEHEVHHLRTLLEEVLPEFYIQMTIDVINPKGVTQGRFSRVEEYDIFCFAPDAYVPSSNDNLLNEPVEKKAVRWKGLLRSGTDARRLDRSNMFYPVYVDEATKKIVGVGEPLPIDVDPDVTVKIDGYAVAWPIRTDGSWGRWSVGADTLRALVEKGYVACGKFDRKRKTWGISYISQPNQKLIEEGKIVIVDRNPTTGVVSVEYASSDNRVIKTVWHRTSHDAGAYGSDLLTSIIGATNAFSFPKSIYSEYDAIASVMRNKKDALIVDFFAGSGTTLHAVNLLNLSDDGQRRCILVTNNELFAEEANALSKAGYRPGDDEWNAHGIARSVTWPRTVGSIVGRSVDGTPLEGTYSIEADAYEKDEDVLLVSEQTGKPVKKTIYRKIKYPVYPQFVGKMKADGFPANAVFFKLGFLDKTKVSLGMQFKELLSTLWMKAGAIGKCPVVDANIPDMLILPNNKMAILNDENCFGEFAKQLAQHPEIDVVYFVTDYESSFVAMTQALDGKKTYQLYRDYLDNFRINAGRNSR